MQFGGPHGRPRSPLLLDHGNLTFLPILERDYVEWPKSTAFLAPFFSFSIIRFGQLVYAIFTPFGGPHGRPLTPSLMFMATSRPRIFMPWFPWCCQSILIHFSLFSSKMEFSVFSHFCSLVTPMGDPLAPSSKLMATPTH